MKVTYDPSVDAMSIFFYPGKKSTRTEEIEPGLLVDYSGNTLISLEILDVSERIPEKNIKNVTFSLLGKSKTYQLKPEEGEVVN